VSNRKLLAELKMGMDNSFSEPAKILAKTTQEVHSIYKESVEYGKHMDQTEEEIWNLSVTKFFTGELFMWLGQKVMKTSGLVAALTDFAIGFVSSLIDEAIYTYDEWGGSFKDYLEDKGLAVSDWWPLGPLPVWVTWDEGGPKAALQWGDPGVTSFEVLGLDTKTAEELANVAPPKTERMTIAQVEYDRNARIAILGVEKYKQVMLDVSTAEEFEKAMADLKAGLKALDQDGRMAFFTQALTDGVMQHPGWREMMTNRDSLRGIE